MFAHTYSYLSRELNLKMSEEKLIIYQIYERISSDSNDLNVLQGLKQDGLGLYVEGITLTCILKCRVMELTTEMGLERGPGWSFVQCKFMMNEGSEGNNLLKERHKQRK